MENRVLDIHYLSKEFHDAFNNYLHIRYSIQRATKRSPSVYTVTNRAEARESALATWKRLKGAMRTANEYKQL